MQKVVKPLRTTAAFQPKPAPLVALAPPLVFRAAVALVAARFARLIYVVVLARVYANARKQHDPLAAAMVLFVVFAALAKLTWVFVRRVLRLSPAPATLFNGLLLRLIVRLLLDGLVWLRQHGAPKTSPNSVRDEELYISKFALNNSHRT